MAKQKTDDELASEIKEEVGKILDQVSQARLRLYAENWLLGPIRTHSITSPQLWLWYLRNRIGRD